MCDKYLINENILRSILQEIEQLKQQQAEKLKLDQETLKHLLTKHGWCMSAKA